MWNNRIALVVACLALLGGTTPAQAQEPPATADFVVVEGDTLWLVEIVEIVGTRVTAALPGIVRTVGVVDEADLARLPGRSAAEVLQTVPGVVVGQRQQYGVQSDVSIRGSSFEQVQVLLDGFDLGDPQTGHHLMDLPLGRQDIQRLEVLPGHGSTLYGSGAFGGTINVVSRRPALPDTAGHPLVTGSEVAAYGGENGTWGTWGNAGLALGQQTGVRISGERFRTDGHSVEQDNQSDADTYSTTARLTHRFDRGEADVFAGYADRQFGAQDFYAPFDSFEKTRTFFAAARYNRTISDRLTLEPRVFFRRHRDEFILFRDNPESYTNDHQSQKAGAELRGLVRLGSGYALSVSLEGGYEDIESRGLRGGVWGEALGNHLRRRASVAAEIDGHHGRVRWQLGSRVDRRTGFASRVSGSAAVSAEVARGLVLRTSSGSVYRLPTFTELYYEDPANQGNAHLDAERGWTWDLGAEYLTGPWNLRVTGFTR
nr:TonB-dependent receptor [Candidatus Krumholzibacteria bacterium]